MQGGSSAGLPLPPNHKAAKNHECSYESFSDRLPAEEHTMLKANTRDRQRTQKPSGKWNRGCHQHLVVLGLT